MDEVKSLSLATQGQEEGEEYLEQLAKCMLEILPKKAGAAEEENTFKTKQMQMARIMLELWKHDREQHCTKILIPELKGVRRSERGPVQRLRMKELFKEYRHEGYWIPQAVTTAGEDSVTEMCDREPGSFLIWLEKEVLEEVLRDEDEDTKRSLAPWPSAEDHVGEA